jgi:hypothetical protein
LERVGASGGEYDVPPSFRQRHCAFATDACSKI